MLESSCDTFKRYMEQFAVNKKNFQKTVQQLYKMLHICSRTNCLPTQYVRFPDLVPTTLRNININTMCIGSQWLKRLWFVKGNLIYIFFPFCPIQRVIIFQLANILNSLLESTIISSSSVTASQIIQSSFFSSHSSHFLTPKHQRKSGSK